MSWFRKSSSPERAAPSPCEPYLELFLAEGFADLEDAVGRLRPDDLDFVVERLAAKVPLARWAHRAPSALSWSASAAAILQRAEALVGHVPRDLDAGVRQGVHALAGQADELADQADKCGEHFLTHLVRLRAGVLRGASTSELFERFRLSVKASPGLYSAHNVLVSALGPLNGGSFEAAVGFAHSVRAAVPAGSLAHTALVSAHIDHWLDLESAGGHATRHVQDPVVVAEVRAAAQGSVLHPRAAAFWYRPDALGRFAFLSRLSLDKPLATELFTHAVAARNWPWQYLGIPAQAFKDAQRWAGG